MHLGRHARRIAIPVQQVEGKRIASHQVVVDDERPDEVVTAQHVERIRHLGALEIAALVHLALERGDLFLVDEDFELAAAAEIDERGHEARAHDAFVLFRRHIGERRRQQRAAEAVAQRIDLTFAGRLFDRVQGRQRTFPHVVDEVLAGESGVRIDP